MDTIIPKRVVSLLLDRYVGGIFKKKSEPFDAVLA